MEARGRRSRAFDVLIAVAVALSTIATLLVAVAAGWSLHDWRPGATRTTSIDVSRPVTVVQQAGPAAGVTPNVIGLGVDTARQAFLDAGVAVARLTTRKTPYAGAAGLVVAQDPSPGSSSTSSAVLSVSVPASMPKVVGRTSDDARDLLSTLGARVIVRSAYRAGATEGSVLATDPGAGKPLTSEATLTVAEAPSSVFLTQLRSVDSTCSTETLAVAGTQQNDALVCQPSVGSPSDMEYVLNRRVSRFTSTIGLGDRGATTTRAIFRVFVDGRLVARHSVAFGSTVRVSVDVVDALRIRLEVALATKTAPTAALVAAWAAPQFLGSRSAIDALVKESTP